MDANNGNINLENFSFPSTSSHNGSSLNSDSDEEDGNYDVLPRYHRNYDVEDDMLENDKYLISYYISKAVQAKSIKKSPENKIYINNLALHMAVKSESMELVEMLLNSQDMDKDLQDEDGSTVLIRAIQRNASDKMIMLLLEGGCDVSIADNSGNTPLHYAIMRWPLDIARYLIVEKNVNVNDQNLQGLTPLHMAANRNNPEAVCMLLYYDADVTITCNDGFTAFMYSVMERKRRDIAEILIEYQDDFSEVTHSGHHTALSLALINENPFALELIRRGADVNQICNADNSHLFSKVLQCKDSSIFREIWPKINLENFSPFLSSFVSSYVIHCRYNAADWLECLYKILDSPISSDLNDELPPSFFNYLFMKFLRKKVPQNDRLGLTACFLSYGVEISVNEIVLIYEMYGFKEELNLLLDCAFIKKNITALNDSNRYSLINFTLGQEMYKNDYIYKKFSMLRRSLGMFLIEDLLKTLGYFSVSRQVRRSIIYDVCDEYMKRALFEKLNVVPEMPTLVELTRNQVRENVKKLCNEKEPYYFVKTIQMLPIPKRLKQILLFQFPLYN